MRPTHTAYDVAFFRSFAICVGARFERTDDKASVREEVATVCIQRLVAHVERPREALFDDFVHQRHHFGPLGRSDRRDLNLAPRRERGKQGQALDVVKALGARARSTPVGTRHGLSLSVCLSLGEKIRLRRI